LTASYEGFLGFTHISLAEFETLFAATRHAFDPRLFIFAYDEQGRLAGFAGGCLDCSDALRAMGTKDGLFGKLLFLYHRRQADRVLFYHGGLTPTEAARRSGLGRAGFYFLLRETLRAGYSQIIAAIRSADNSSRGLWGAGAPRAQREYALYELVL
jgi:hypothetical protein